MATRFAIIIIFVGLQKLVNICCLVFLVRLSMLLATFNQLPELQTARPLLQLLCLFAFVFVLYQSHLERYSFRHVILLFKEQSVWQGWRQIVIKVFEKVLIDLSTIIEAGPSV
jgi:hypothetical protein